ncbi:MAG: TRAP transporter small permease [Alphaproteobacteria bacterium]|jgi:TRAP-type C4-dicarboxylate transport system permease small subunit|nr:TRAP transporter small permease [Alphaproteobacteria bacterium]MDP6813492.1 TRAP transporter small permease [Alphaproteobacteria bacterium]
MRILDLIDRVVLVIAILALVTMMLLTTVSVIGRYLFSAPIPDDLVMSEFLMVFVVFLPLSVVQAAREHVFVTIFSDWAPNKAKVVMETIGVIVGFVIFTIITTAVWTDFQQAWEVGAYVDGPLELPESPARFVVFFGLALFSVRLLVDAITTLKALADGTALATLSEETRVLEKEIGS